MIHIGGERDGEVWLKNPASGDVIEQDYPSVFRGWLWRGDVIMLAGDSAGPDEHISIVVPGTPYLTLPTKVPSDSLGRIGNLKRTSDKSLFPMALGGCGHRITYQLRPINMNGRSILSVTSYLIFRN